jgi:uncharacterized membrane protein
MAFLKYYILGIVLLSFVVLNLFRIYNSRRESRRQEQRDRLKETRERYIKSLLKDGSTEEKES